MAGKNRNWSPITFFFPFFSSFPFTPLLLSLPFLLSVLRLLGEGKGFLPPPPPDSHVVGEINRNCSSDLFTLFFSSSSFLFSSSLSLSLPSPPFLRGGGWRRGGGWARAFCPPPRLKLIDGKIAIDIPLFCFLPLFSFPLSPLFLFSFPFLPSLLIFDGGGGVTAGRQGPFVPPPRLFPSIHTLSLSLSLSLFVCGGRGGGGGRPARPLGSAPASYSGQHNPEINSHKILIVLLWT